MSDLQPVFDDIIVRLEVELGRDMENDERLAIHRMMRAGLDYDRIHAVMATLERPRLADADVPVRRAELIDSRGSGKFRDLDTDE
jgi:hypothetical protein